jgi:predicted hotdog family 3-hydroxylacyl-ACP dehydratase
MLGGCAPGTAAAATSNCGVHRDTALLMLKHVVTYDDEFHCTALVRSTALGAVLTTG